MCSKFTVKLVLVAPNSVDYVNLQLLLAKSPVSIIGVVDLELPMLTQQHVNGTFDNSKLTEKQSSW